MEKLYVTSEGLDKLKTDLAQLNEKRLRVAAAIEFARGMGDLSENAEYHAAKEQQALVHAKIRDLEDKITRAVIMDESEIDPNKAFMGARVRVLNKKTKKEIVYYLVSPVEADSASGKISIQSPVGIALRGHVVGDTVIGKVPAGDLEFEILEISRRGDFGF